MKRFYSTKTILTLMSVTMLIDPLAQAASTLDCQLMNHPAHQDEYSNCLNMQISIAGGEAGVDCVACNQAKVPEPNPWVEALGIVAQPLAAFGGMYFGAKFQAQSQEAWANSYTQGYQQCTNRFNSYLDYNTQAGANPILPAEAQSFAASCNNNGMGQYAGYGGMSGNGYGGFGNPMLSGGYSSGMLGGMMGPYYGGGYGGGIGMGGNGSGGGFGMGLGMGLGNGLAGMLGYGMGGGINIGIGGGVGYGSYNPYGNGGYNPYGNGGGINGGVGIGIPGIGINGGGGYNPYGNSGYNPYGNGGGINGGIGIGIGIPGIGINGGGG
ncbi:MAG: hypothetical protein PHY93_19890, partial [Bacteriovorax sp.]|nr:hypothetical protein [Bacteriovorax sp.]